MCVWVYVIFFRTSSSSRFAPRAWTVSKQAKRSSKKLSAASGSTKLKMRCNRWAERPDAKLVCRAYLCRINLFCPVFVSVRDGRFVSAGNVQSRSAQNHLEVSALRLLRWLGVWACSWFQEKRSHRRGQSHSEKLFLVSFRASASVAEPCGMPAGVSREPVAAWPKNATVDSVSVSAMQHNRVHRQTDVGVTRARDPVCAGCSATLPFVH